MSEFPKSSILEIEIEKSIPHTTIHRILVDDLKYHHVVGQWVPYALTEAQRKIRVDEAQNILYLLQNPRKRLSIIEQLVMIDEKWIFLRYIGTKS